MRRRRQGELSGEDCDQEGDESEVEAIVDKRTRRGREEFLVHWKGLDPIREATWEPPPNLTNCTELLRSFENAKLGDYLHVKIMLLTISLFKHCSKTANASPITTDADDKE